MNGTTFEGFRFVILPGKPPAGFAHSALHNRAYAVWKEFWSEVLQGNGCPDHLDRDDFLRQDRIAVICRGDEIVALHAYTFFDLSSLPAREHSYLERYYTPTALKALSDRNVRSLMTMEFFSVLPEWRGLRSGPPLALVLADLGFRFAETAGVDAVVSVIRTDTGVDRLARQFNGHVLDSGIRIHNTPCDLMAFFSSEPHRHPAPEVRAAVEQLWTDRQDTLPPQPEALRPAAGRRLQLVRGGKSPTRARLEQVIAQISPSIAAFPWEDPASYGHWLAQTHFLVRHTTTFLALSAAKLGPERMELHQQTLRHLKEETGHEQLATRDLQALGLDLKLVPELLETRMIYQSQYYWLERFGPTAHLGYALMLEGLAAKEGAALMARLIDAHGKGATAFLRLHAAEDTEHFERGIERLEQASEIECTAALENLEQSRELYRAMLASVIAHASAASPPLRNRTAQNAFGKR